jgi:hypothetical protein
MTIMLPELMRVLPPCKSSIRGRSRTRKGPTSTAKAAQPAPRKRPNLATNTAKAAAPTEPPQSAVTEVHPAPHLTIAPRTAPHHHTPHRTPHRTPRCTRRALRRHPPATCGTPRGPPPCDSMSHRMRTQFVSRARPGPSHPATHMPTPASAQPAHTYVHRTPRHARNARHALRRRPPTTCDATRPAAARLDEPPPHQRNAITEVNDQ